MQQQKAKEMREREFAELKERSQKSLEMQTITMTVHCISTIGEWSDQPFIYVYVMGILYIYFNVIYSHTDFLNWPVTR